MQFRRVHIAVSVVTKSMKVLPVFKTLFMYGIFVISMLFCLEYDIKVKFLSV